MVKLLSIFTIILAIVLFPPAALALVSNSAVPGDKTYPIKRSLEDIIYSVASLNPTTQAWFSAARSGRRYKEFTILITQGKFEKNSLNELVSQTGVAVAQVNQITNTTTRIKYIDELSQNLNKYNQGLQQIENQTTPERPKFSPTPSSTPTFVAIPRSTSPVQPTAIPTTSPQPPPAQAEQPSSAFEDKELVKQQQQIIENARKAMEEYQRQLEKEKKKSEEPTVTSQPNNLAGVVENKQRLSGINQTLKIGVSNSTSELIPQATCKTDCSLCTTMQLPKCNLTKVYDTCVDNSNPPRGSTDPAFCTQGATLFKCFSSENENCNSVDSSDSSNAFIYSCSACNTDTFPSPTPASIPEPPSSE